MNKLRVIILLLFSLFFLFPPFAQTQNLKIHFLDVGEGDAVFIQSPHGKTVLVDAGNLITGFRVGEYLKRNNVQRLDYLIFTHPHFDHIGGAFFVMQMMEVREVFDNGENLVDWVNSVDMYRWYNKLVRSKDNYRGLKTGDTIVLDEIRLNVLWPQFPSVSLDFNANSLVIMLEYGEFRCLLAGDLTDKGENVLLNQGLDLKADVLKVGHHGAGDANSEEFLLAISPKIAIISVDKSNLLGYPSEEVLNRFRGNKVKIYRTDRDGDIILTVYLLKKGKSPKINIERHKSFNKS
ncbi:MAG: MBL fold metallo-hydrolase [Candidatus Omnitrophica bacterium]|nr:MBL fold metallo-hydrolase [Candidatus Omnitrophota bacterium]MCM8827040.1 MBL fold metallo-hydrolase [Candidatus Omnitrophota bacterium]